MTALLGQGAALMLAMVAGFGVGCLHFHSLRAVTVALVAGAPRAMALQLLRLLGMTLFLALCAWLSAGTLLAAAAGVLAGRQRVLRQARGVPL